MIRRLLGIIISLVKIPIKIVMLPFKILSTVFSLMFYLSVLLSVGAIVYFFVL